MVQKMTILIFISKISHDELINVVFFFLRPTFISQKIRYNYMRCRPQQKWRTLVRRVTMQELQS